MLHAQQTQNNIKLTQEGGGGLPGNTMNNIKKETRKEKYLESSTTTSSKPLWQLGSVREEVLGGVIRSLGTGGAENKRTRAKHYKMKLEMTPQSL